MRQRPGPGVATVHPSSIATHGESRCLVGIAVPPPPPFRAICLAGSYEPLQKDRGARLEAMKTRDGQPLQDRLKAELSRELDVIDLLLKQSTDVSAESEVAAGSDEAANGSPAALPARLKGIGPHIA